MSTSHVPTHVEYVATEDSVLAVVRGEVDFSTLHHLNPAIRAALDSGVDLVVDVRDVPFVDSSTACFLAKVAHDLQLAGRRVVVVNARPVVQRLLEILSLDYLAA